MPTLELEERLFSQGYSLVAGVDEAGRGPLAGPVAAGAVLLSSSVLSSPSWLDGIDDSKRLSALQRERALERIKKHADGFGVGMASAAEIDEVGIAVANRRAMLRALEALPMRPDYVLIDYFPLHECNSPFQALVGGDRRCLSIAAASILAKVTRDRLMEEADKEYPQYGFARHKGYATAEHLRNLSLLGPCPLHRRSFSPVASRQIVSNVTAG